MDSNPHPGRRDTNARNLFEVDPPSGSVLSRGGRGWCWREGKGEGERVVGLMYFNLNWKLENEGVECKLIFLVFFFFGKWKSWKQLLGIGSFEVGEEEEFLWFKFDRWNGLWLILSFFFLENERFFDSSVLKFKDIERRGRKRFYHFYCLVIHSKIFRIFLSIMWLISESQRYIFISKLYEFQEEIFTEDCLSLLIHDVQLSPLGQYRRAKWNFGSLNFRK